MKKVKQFDIADEIFDEHEEDKYLIRKYVKSKYCRLIETKIKTSNNPYNKEKGHYTSIEFDDLYLDEIYQENEIENYDTDYVGQILKMDAKKFKRLIEDSDIKLVKTIAGRAVELFRNGKFDSRIKEEVLCAKLNREDLFEM